MNPTQFKAVFDQLAPAIVELFNEAGGMNPRMLWVKLVAVDSCELAAAGEAAEAAAIERIFKGGEASSMIPVMVADLMESAEIPAELGGGRIDGVVVCGETTTIRKDGTRGDSLGIWIHSATRTEFTCLPVDLKDGKRTAGLGEIVISEGGRTGPMTMHPGIAQA